MHKQNVIVGKQSEIMHEIYLFMAEIYNFMHNHDEITNKQNVFM